MSLCLRVPLNLRYYIAKLSPLLSNRLVSTVDDVPRSAIAVVRFVLLPLRHFHECHRDATSDRTCAKLG
jgi:hypothetical protein